MFNLFNLPNKIISLYHNKRKVKNRTLQNNPQKSGIVNKVRITTPRKPNSARRKTVKLNLTIFKKTSISYIPGGNHTLKKFSKVLIRGGGARDLPGVSTTCIRGCKDLKPVFGKTKRRSIYGVQKNKK